MYINANLVGKYSFFQMLLYAEKQCFVKKVSHFFYFFICLYEKMLLISYLETIVFKKCALEVYDFLNNKTLFI
jgi:hypothetical protein